jgi:single-strand DNA-binding protein
MAGSYNKVLLMGNLTRDVELRHLPNSASGSVANFGLAVNRRFRTKDGEQREEVTFVDCEAWGKTGELISQYFRKGRPIFVEGWLKLDTWEKEGQKHTKLRVVVDNFQFVDSKEGGGGEGGPRPASSTAAKPAAGAPRTQPTNYEPVPEEEIPF